MLLTVLVLSLVVGAISPDFFAFTLLDVIDPGSGVSASVDVSGLAESVGLVVAEFAYVNVTFGVPESAPTVSFVIVPLTLIDSSVIPLLDTVSLSEFLLFSRHRVLDHKHLTFINGSIWKKIVLNKDQILIWRHFHDQIIVSLLKRVLLVNVWVYLMVKIWRLNQILTMLLLIVVGSFHGLEVLVLVRSPSFGFVVILLLVKLILTVITVTCAHTATHFISLKSYKL